MCPQAGSGEADAMATTDPQRGAPLLTAPQGLCRRPIHKKRTGPAQLPGSSHLPRHSRQRPQAGLQPGAAGSVQGSEPKTENVGGAQHAPPLTPLWHRQGTQPLHTFSCGRGWKRFPPSSLGASPGITCKAPGATSGTWRRALAKRLASPEASLECGPRTHCGRC